MDDDLPAYVPPGGFGHLFVHEPWPGDPLRCTCRREFPKAEYQQAHAELYNRIRHERRADETRVVLDYLERSHYLRTKNPQSNKRREVLARVRGIVEREEHAGLSSFEIDTETLMALIAYAEEFK